MRIAFLNKYQSKVFRGAETFVYELSSRLSKNHQIEIINEIDYSNLLRERYDVIIPINGRLQVVLTRIVAWIKNSKVVVSGQSGMGWDDRVNLYSFPDVFIALSPSAQSWARGVNPFVKSEYIPNGVDLKKFKGRGVKFNNSLRGPVVLAVGAFTRQKRLDLAIKAVARLKGGSLLVVGSGGGERANLESLGGRLLGNRFQIISVPFEKMPAVYRSADIFTLPSASSEAFGNVLVEAMASGLPVVATDDLIRREIVEDAGLFVDPTDTDFYAKALEKALQTNWGDKPRKQAEKFSWEEIAKKYAKLFETLKK